MSIESRLRQKLRKIETHLFLAVVRVFLFRVLLRFPRLPTGASASWH
jgi:hypothetical protein